MCPFSVLLLLGFSGPALQMPSTRNGGSQDTPNKETKGDGDEESSASEEDSCSCELENFFFLNYKFIVYKGLFKTRLCVCVIEYDFNKILAKCLMPAVIFIMESSSVALQLICVFVCEKLPCLASHYKHINCVIHLSQYWLKMMTANYIHTRIDYAYGHEKLYFEVIELRKL